MADEVGKRAAAARGAAEVAGGQLIGLGSGSTVDLLVAALGERARREGLRIEAVAASASTERAARAAGIPLRDLSEVGELDLALDGADEVDPAGRLLKGGGGALLREKLVALAARRLVVLVDRRKLVRRLGERMPLPVEVVPFGWRRTAERLRGLGLTPVLRGGEGSPYRTDNGNLILDCTGDFADLGREIKALTGVVEHGIFAGFRPRVIVGGEDGSTEVRQLSHQS
jgi:ribose 5-phosphate isomerase A